MARKMKVTYKEPASYFTPEMLAFAEEWERKQEEKRRKAEKEKSKKQKETK